MPKGLRILKAEGAGLVGAPGVIYEQIVTDVVVLIAAIATVTSTGAAGRDGESADGSAGGAATPADRQVTP